MARTAIPLETLVGPYPTSLPVPPGSALLTQVAADVANMNSVAFGAFHTLVVIAINTDGALARTVTFTSSPDEFNRVGDITAYSIPSGNSMAGFIFKRDGWATSGQLYLQADNAAVKFVVFGLR